MVTRRGNVGRRGAGTGRAARGDRRAAGSLPRRHRDRERAVDRVLAEPLAPFIKDGLTQLS